MTNTRIFFDALDSGELSAYQALGFMRNCTWVASARDEWDEYIDLDFVALRLGRSENMDIQYDIYNVPNVVNTGKRKFLISAHFSIYLSELAYGTRSFAVPDTATFKQDAFDRFTIQNVYSHIREVMVFIKDSEIAIKGVITELGQGFVERPPLKEGDSTTFAITVTDAGYYTDIDDSGTFVSEGDRP